MVILWVNIRVRPPPSWNSVFGTTWLRFSSRSRFRARVRNLVGPGPGHLPAAQPPTAKRPADHVDVVYRDVIAGSRESRGHHYDAPFIYRILKSLFPQNNTFFIATASVVKDALDTTDCERLREQWYYLQFYVRRTMPPTVGSLCPKATNFGSQNFGYQIWFCTRLFIQASVYWPQHFYIGSTLTHWPLRDVEVILLVSV